MRKLLLGLLLAVVTLSCSNDNEVLQNEKNVTETSKTANKLEAGSNVKLFKAWIGLSQRYGFVQQDRKFQVEVRNIAYNKEVYIVHKMTDGTWKEYPLTYKNSTPDNTEIWAADVYIDGSYYTGAPTFVGFDDQFAVKYKVNGQEYWDNNGSQNYKTTSTVEGVGSLGMMLKQGLNISVDTNSSKWNQYGENGSFYVTADVKNIGFSKEVKLVYTTDGWATNQVVPLGYQSSYAVGGYNYQSGVNAYGVERWGTSVAIAVPATVQNIEYAVVYKVNGVEYWDNNFGQNYKPTKVVY